MVFDARVQKYGYGRPIINVCVCVCVWLGGGVDSEFLDNAAKHG